MQKGVVRIPRRWDYGRLSFFFVDDKILILEGGILKKITGTVLNPTCIYLFNMSVSQSILRHIALPQLHMKHLLCDIIVLPKTESLRLSK